MTIACLYHVRMTIAMVKTRTKVVETTGSQVVITEAGKEMTVLTIINNLRKICACLFITDNLQENYVCWRQNDRKKDGTTPMVSETTETATGMTKATCGVALYTLL